MTEKTEKRGGFNPIREFILDAMKRRIEEGRLEEPKDAEDLARRIAEGVLYLGLLPHALQFPVSNSSSEASNMPSHEENAERIATEVYILLLEHLSRPETCSRRYVDNAGMYYYH